MESQGYNISGGEFRYLRTGETVSCRYDADMKDKLEKRLTDFKNCLENINADGYKYPYGKQRLFAPIQDQEKKKEKCATCSYAKVCNGRI